MRLYSRGQVVYFSTMSAAVLLIVLLATGLVRVPSLRASRPQPVELKTSTTLDEGLQASTITSESQPIKNAVSSVRYSEGELENIDIYRRLNAGVVNVTAETVGLNWFLEPVPQGGGIGSGSIIDKRGYVLTNYHVVEKAYKVAVTLSDGVQFAGKIIGSDPENDLAIIKFDPGTHPLVTVPFGSSEDLKVGQKVLAIGNPFGLNRTLTTGIVSGLGRPIRAGNGLVMRDMIQTDASINPGNSGGPLLSSRGLMIGINTMIYTPSGGSVGIGFAIPIDAATRVIPELLKYGEVRRGWIDIVPVQLSPAIVQYAQLPVAKGLLVSRVDRGGNAAAAGIVGGDTSKPVRYGQSVIYLGGDIIVGVNKYPVATISDLFSALEDTRPGQTVPVQIVKHNGRSETVAVALDSRPKGLAFE